MTSLILVIAAACSVGSGESSDYDWNCVDKINNCAVDKKGKTSEELIKKCLEEYQDEK